jgi:S-adenosylmethionine:tRNA ribosyltransferase-isomerase
MDRHRYQTIYASVPGAVAAPTAGLHFTPELFRGLEEAGHPIARVTLHVGMGTFLPVKGEELSEHAMHAEWYELPEAAASTLSAARREGRRIVAVGTTSVRVLETVARHEDAASDGAPPAFAPQSGWTDIFLYPPCEFRAVDALITNFHLPRSTLLMLVAAFCSPGQTDGLPLILDAYAQAARLRYRFYSYGDAMLIE